MNEKTHIISLFGIMEEESPYGTAMGRKAHAKLLDRIDELFGVTTIGISLDRIVSADVSFFRESIIYTIKRYSKKFAFFVCGTTNEDIIDNLQGAAVATEQRITCWVGNDCRFLGPEPSSSSKALLELVVNNRTTTTADAAASLDISVQNASTRLKRLADEGFLVRTEESAESGGKEYVYSVARHSA